MWACAKERLLADLRSEPTFVLWTIFHIYFFFSKLQRTQREARNWDCISICFCELKTVSGIVFGLHTIFDLLKFEVRPLPTANSFHSIILSFTVVLVQNCRSLCAQPVTVDLPNITSDPNFGSMMAALTEFQALLEDVCQGGFVNISEKGEQTCILRPFKPLRTKSIFHCIVKILWVLDLTVPFWFVVNHVTIIESTKPKTDSESITGKGP